VSRVHRSNLQQEDSSVFSHIARWCIMSWARASGSSAWRSRRSPCGDRHARHHRSHPARPCTAVRRRLSRTSEPGVGFMTMPPERWQMYLRYDTTIARDFFRTLDALTRLQHARQRKAEPKHGLARAAGSAAELSDSGIRSVSQTSPAAPEPAPKANEQERKSANTNDISMRSASYLPNSRHT
jgi:hypothetical protein